MKRLLEKVWPRPGTHAAGRLKKGLEHESRGDLISAESEYRKVLKADRLNQDAIYLLGSVCAKVGKLAEAKVLLETFLEGNQRFAPAIRDYALVLHSSGQRAAAIEHLHKAVALDPSDPVPALNLARIHSEDGRLAAAESTLRNLLGLLPDQKDALAMLAALLVDDGRSTEANVLLAGALARRPDADLAYQLGAVCQASNDAAGARAALETAAGIRPDHKPALHALGRLALRDGRPDEARGWLQRAFDADPSDTALPADLGEAFLRLRIWGEARRWLGMAIDRDPGNITLTVKLALIEYNASRYEEAQRLYQRVIAQWPDDAVAHAGLGRCLQQLGRFEDAVECYRRALEISPALQEALNNLGTALQELGRFEEAAAHFEHTLGMFPDFLDARSNLGLAYMDLGRSVDAIRCFDEVLGRDPQLDEARFNRAVARLRSGDYANGWGDYDARWGSRFAVRRPFHYPEWEGSELAGRRLLVYGEQGLGDEIMFASCVPDLLSTGASVVLECSPKLEALFARSFPNATLVSRAGNAGAPEKLPAVDVQMASGDLPRLYRRERRCFPNHEGYLRADPGRVAFWRARLETLGPGLKIGLSWRGGAVKTRRRLRSLDLERVMTRIHRPDAAFVSLQYTDCSDEVRALEREHGLVVHHWQQAIDDYDETAALVCALDVVVTVCTSMVHLSGALGRTAFVMVPFSPEWRYGDRGETMPWYPSVRLIRQRAPDEWEQVLEQVSQAVDDLVEQRGRNVLT